jgi:hypothetical protein
LKETKKAPKNQFTVAIDVELPHAAVQKIVQAIQKAVLVELAGTQLNAPLGIDFGGRTATGQAAAAAIGIPGTSTQGIFIRTTEE